MGPPAAEQWDDTEQRTIELPVTSTPQQALHEAVGHLYDELALAEHHRNDVTLPEDAFARMEELYVATAEESVSSVTITYELEN